jgi:hypothetical protein
MMEHWHIILIGMIGQAVLGLVIAVIGYFIKRNISLIDKRLEDGDKKFARLDNKMNELTEKRALDREYFAKEYVSKDDFIRDIRALDVKIDGVAADVKELLRSTRREGDAQI